MLASPANLPQIEYATHIERSEALRRKERRRMAHTTLLGHIIAYYYLLLAVYYVILLSPLFDSYDFFSVSAAMPSPNNSLRAFSFLRPPREAVVVELWLGKEEILPFKHLFCLIESERCY